MHRQHVQRSIKRLIQLGIILEGVKIGISRSYRLNPSFGWKGSAKGHREVLHEHLKVIKDKGAQGAWGSFSDTGDMRPPITRQPSKATQTQTLRDSIVVSEARGSRPLNPQTLKMSAYGTLFPTARPQGSCQHPWALPTPRVRHVAGVQGKPPAPLPQSVGSPPTCKGQAASGCFASLDRFPAPSAWIVLLLSRRWRGVKGGEAVHFTLDALSRPNTSPQGQVVGF